MEKEKCRVGGEPQTQDCPEFITLIFVIAHLSELGCAQRSPLNE